MSVLATSTLSGTSARKRSRFLSFPSKYTWILSSVSLFKEQTTIDIENGEGASLPPGARRTPFDTAVRAQSPVRVTFKTDSLDSIKKAGCATNQLIELTDFDSMCCTVAGVRLPVCRISDTGVYDSSLTEPRRGTDARRVVLHVCSKHHATLDQLVSKRTGPNGNDATCLAHCLKIF